MTPGKSRRLAEIRGHRGANDNHTDVVVDGNELSDTINIEYDFSNLLTVDTKCVEIVRDGHSRIYGSDTIGSVDAINVQIAKLVVVFQPTACPNYIRNAGFGSR